jgi:membrane associated rhomboid family serine protease
MGWRDRPYASDDSYPDAPMRLALPRPTTTVTWLIVANVVAFVLDTLTQHADPRFWPMTFGLSWNGLFGGKVWQPVTYMFSHAGIWHLLGNMIGLYIFGMHFEQAFGRDRFLKFYAFCGLVGGAGYLALSLVDPSFRSRPIIGASGAVYGLLIAAIIFFPHIRVIVIIFPMPIRTFGLLIAGILLLRLISPGGVPNWGGEVCHMFGAAAGLGLLYYWRMIRQPRVLSGMTGKIKQGAWERRRKQEAAEQAEVDRILAKVSDEGIQSLTRAERKALERATRRQQEEDRPVKRM